MSIRSFSVTGLALLCLSSLGLAYIHPSAPSASHALEESATELHSWMHTNYSSGYGSHGMETASVALHAGLHEWSMGMADECDIEALQMGTDAAFTDLSTQFVLNGVFLNPTATSMFYDVHFDKQIVDVYLSFLNCVPMHPTTKKLAGKPRALRNPIAH